MLRSLRHLQVIKYLALNIRYLGIDGIGLVSTGLTVYSQAAVG